MLKLIFLLLILSLSAFGSETCLDKWNYIKTNFSIPEKYKSLDGLCDSEFRKKLLSIISTNIDLGYNNARKIMFSKLDNHNGEVCDVYTSYCVNTVGIPNASLMNCEHTWPQSMGAVGLAKSDLNHLFPTESRVNSIRNNHPFCEVKNSTWGKDGSFLGTSITGKKCFEPRDQHKGEVARAFFYFSVRYGKTLDQEQEAFIQKWNSEFPPTQVEIDRNNMIEEIQKNRNPFIDVPYFSNLISDY